MSQEIRAPTKIDYANILNDIRPQMNINIPLMQQTMRPTWTTQTSPEISQPTTFESGTQNSETQTDNTKYDANKQWLDRISKIDSERPMSPLSLGYIYARSSQPMHINGNMVSSGMNWGRDAQITSQMNSFQGAQNSADRALAQTMQNKGFQQQTTMQNSNFDFQKTMQQNSQNFEQQMQARNFDFQHQMQSGLFQHEDTMQGRNIANQQQMQASNQSFTSSMLDKTFGQNKELTTMNIAGTLANTALGGVVGLAGNVVSKGIDYYTQQKNFQNQQQLMTQNFNQQIQASGSRAQALKLTSDN